jgi:hypothetical protein
MHTYLKHTKTTTRPTSTFALATTKTSNTVALLKRRPCLIVTSSLSNCGKESEGKAAGVSVQEQSILLVGAQEEHERGVSQVGCVCVCIQCEFEK